MATIYSNQYAGAYVNKPMEQIKPGDISGDVHFAFFDFTVPAVAPTNGDIVKLCKLPKGAKVVDFKLIHPALGAGSLNVGWAASAELLPGSTTPAEAAVANGLAAAVAVTAAGQAVIANTAVGNLKDFAAEVDVQIDIATTWTATTGVVKGYIKYVVV